MSDRATSTMLSYALTLSVLTVLVAGVFVAAGGMVEDQQERSIRSELEVVGNRIAADVVAVDRLALADESSTAELSIDVPERVAGTSYRIGIDQVGDLVTIGLATTDPSVDVTVTVKTTADVASTERSGGDLRITYDGTEIEVTNA